jgi:hypothetical protein
MHNMIYVPTKHPYTDKLIYKKGNLEKNKLGRKNNKRRRNDKKKR